MKKIALLIVLTVSFSALYSQQGGGQSDNPDGPVINFEKTLHDYGTIHVGSDGTCEFKFINTGNQPLIISTVRASCGCTVPAFPRDPIMPGESGSIKIRYDTNRRGVIMRQATVVSNASTPNTVLTIKGNVVPRPTEELPTKQIDENSAPVLRTN